MAISSLTGLQPEARLVSNLQLRLGMKAQAVKNQIVFDWMRPDIASIQVNSTLEEAVQRMRSLGVHHLVVKDRQVYADVLSAQDCLGQWDKTQTVSSLLSHRSPVPTVDETTDVKTVVDLFVKRRITGVPLVRQGEISGIITATDLIRLLEWELTESKGLTSLVERGKEFLAQPIVQSLTRLLGGSGI